MLLKFNVSSLFINKQIFLDTFYDQVRDIIFLEYRYFLLFYNHAYMMIFYYHFHSAGWLVLNSFYDPKKSRQIISKTTVRYLAEQIKKMFIKA